MYTEYFGFREKPFNVTPDPRFFYTNDVYQEAYASLLYGIRERKGFVVLTGEVGTGKTTLLRRLMANLDESIHFAFFYNTTLSFDELLTFVCEDFGLQPEGKSPLQKIQLLNAFLLSCLQQGGTGVLLIDEAQNLSDEVLENLRLLSNLETSSEKLLQIVLVGQPELEKKLAQPKLRQFRQRVAIQARLDVLKDREILPFIRHRLQTVGYGSSDLFPLQTIARICRYAKGTPRLINVICDNALLLAYGTGRKVISVEMIEEVASDLRLKIESAGGREEPAETSRVESTALPPAVRTPPVLPPPAAAAPPAPSVNVPVRPEPTKAARSNIAGIAAALALAAVGAAVVANELPRLYSFGIGSDAGEELPERAGTPERLPSPEVAEEQAAVAGAGAVAATADPALERRTEEGIEQSSALASGPGPQASMPGDSLVVEYGTTALAIISQHYGGYNTLAMDLTKEANPQIADLDRLLAGEKISLPPLTRESLLRRQPDGSYHLVVASFRSPREAENLAQTIRQKGYAVEMVPRDVTGTISLYRVEIRDLRDPATVDRAWKLVDVDRVLP